MSEAVMTFTGQRRKDEAFQTEWGRGQQGSAEGSEGPVLPSALLIPGVRHRVGPPRTFVE